MIKRTKRVEIRLTDDEYNQLIERKTKTRLAEWLRDIALNQKIRRKQKTADPKLLFELNRIGVNLNQIARYCNSNKANLDTVKIALELANIESHIKSLLEKNE